MKTTTIILAASLALPAYALEGEKLQIYSPVGKRDPFKPPSPSASGKDLLSLNPLERFAIEQFQLRAILKGLGKNRAMIEDPEGRTYIIAEGDRIGKERASVSKILTNEIIVTEKTFNYLGNLSLYEKILSLPADKEISQAIPERSQASEKDTSSPAKRGP